jgi:hypothetical protein
LVFHVVALLVNIRCWFVPSRYLDTVHTLIGNVVIGGMLNMIDEAVVPEAKLKEHEAPFDPFTCELKETELNVPDRLPRPVLSCHTPGLYDAMSNHAYGGGEELGGRGGKGGRGVGGDGMGSQTNETYKCFPCP